MAVQETATERDEEETPQTLPTAARARDVLKRHYDQVAARHPGTTGAGAANQIITPDTSITTQVDELDDLPHGLPGKLLPSEPYIVSFSPLQEWEGYVTAITDDAFTVRLVSITGGPKSDSEEVSLPISDLDAKDRALLKPGAILRWVIGYEITRTGRRKKASQIVIRRLPKWTKRELEEAKEEGRKKAEQIKWE